MKVVMKIVIGSTERGILYKDKQFVQILEPGTYRYVNLLSTMSAEIYDITKTPELKSASARLIAKEFSDSLDKNLIKIVTSNREVAVVYLNNQAYEIIMPAEERLFWRGLSDITVEHFDISATFELDKSTIQNLSRNLDERKVLNVKVPEQHKGILLESGVITRVLEPGVYAFWRALRDISVVVLDTRLTAFEVSGQEMLTKDKVSLRLNLSVSYRVADVAMAMRSLSNIEGELYRSAQLSLRQTVGEKTLDELLESKEALNRALADELTSTVKNFGIEVQRVGVKDIILPGEMRTLFNQVVEAEKAAQAHNIRRREETAATRSLLNTAKMMENNPVLLRLKELEAVERVSEKVGKLTVYDGLQGVMKGLVSLRE
jgi:regulator of protease activity HflC (stomatin/prohibitin superfamily)